MTSPSSDYNLSSVKGIPSDIPATEGYSLFIYRLFENFCPFAVGGILFLAASLKAFSLFSEPVLEESPVQRLTTIGETCGAMVRETLRTTRIPAFKKATAFFGGFGSCVCSAGVWRTLLKFG